MPSCAGQVVFPPGYLPAVYRCVVVVSVAAIMSVLLVAVMYVRLVVCVLLMKCSLGLGEWGHNSGLTNFKVSN